MVQSPAVVFFFWALLIPAAGPAGVLGRESLPPGPSPTDQQIESLVGDLGDPSYQVRARATRRLCMIGQRAAPALQQAAASDEFEVALRATNLLEVIDSVYFGGCTIELAVAKSRLAWNEAVELTVSIRNESRYRALVPLEPPGPSRDRRSANAGQVGDMLDLAEHLLVVSPDGREVALRVDAIRADPGVAQAVEWRADGGPMVELAPGQRMVARVADFNRGWARYPLLWQGTYSIRFVYEPQWDDEEFRRAGVGRVTSDALQIEVTKAAPSAVRLARLQAEIAIEWVGAELAAFLTNTDDLPIWVNLNLAGIEPPFAELVWTVQAGQVSEDLRMPAAEGADLDGFSRTRLVKLAPASRLELGRASVARLIKADRAAELLATGAGIGVRASWANLTDAAWQRRQGPALLDDPRTPAALRTLLPPRMLTGRFESKAIQLGRQRLLAGTAP